VDDPFGSATPETQKLYEQLIRSLKKLGPFQIENKKTCVHLARKSAFAGVHPRKQHLLITIKTAKPLDSERVVKSEQVSKSRWHQDIKLTSKDEIDSELLAWMREAYEL
jgi:hypothetical protein